MKLESIFLIIAIIAVLLWSVGLVFSMIAIMPFGLIGLAVFAFILYVAWRLYSEHASNPEDRYYEENFDK